jgi:membrane fusion protein, multidrug efflux system
MTPRVKAYGVLVLILLLGAGFYGYRKYGKESTAKASTGTDSKADPADQVTPVELAAAVEGPISSFLSSSANLRALREVAVTSQADGIVTRVSAEEGDFVDQGQQLCLLDDRELQINLKLAEERAAQAQLQYEKAGIRKEKSHIQILNTGAELKRKELAFAEQLVSQEEVAQLRYTVAELQHDERVAASEEIEFGHRVEELKGEVEQVKLNISRTKISAPFAGHITERTVQLGQMVRNQDSLYRLGSFSPLYADIHLSEAAARQVRPGQTAAVHLGAETEAGIPGTVERISPVVDGSTGTVKVTVRLTPSGRSFRPGAFVQVAIETDTRQKAVLIPKRAVMEEDGESFVFTTSDGIAHRKKVEIGYQNEGEVEVREGLAPGDKVVVAGQGNLKEGAKVREVET